ncbi:MAG: class I adenylate cyclase [Gammaproteobacteria bacterium]|nr:class I adenylate cyclase [Gammaproteobacteria bacterium]
MGNDMEPILDSEMDAGLDRKELANVKKRFVRLNRQRLFRMRKGLSQVQRDFSDIVILAIHENHPILPGYINKEVPSGISDYTPGKIAIRAAKRMAKSFTLKKRAQMKREILSIFIMGSSGTIGHSGDSDFDIWVCHRKDLDDEGLDLLQQKLTLISEWAKSIKLDAHFFLMDEDYFRRQNSAPMDKEASGSSQHFLLLDEFYRTAILLAGRYPLWWMVPVEENANYETYANELLDKRYLRPNDWIDFGHIPNIPADEFFGAALWQVYKGIDSPYKSVIKIVLMEVYASMHPDVSPLCQDYKKLVYKEDPEPNRIDPYLMVYRKVESYLLKRKEYERLELIRRCFYIKVNIKVSKPPKTAAFGWRRELITELTRQWAWEQDQLLQLDSRKDWKINRVVTERRKLVQELTNSYKFLSGFARQNSVLSRISQQDIDLLGKKLYAAFERRSGKLEFVNPGIAPSLHEEFLTFHHTKSSNNIENWLLYKDKVDERDAKYHSSIKRSTSLFKLVSWAFLNGLLSRMTKVQLNKGDSEVVEKELKQVCSGIIQRFPDNLKKPDDAAFRKPARNIFTMIIANLGTDPMAEFTRRGLQLVSNKTDALNYGNQHLNLAINLEILHLNSWGEVSFSAYSNKNALITCLTAWLQQLPEKENHKPALEVTSYCQTRAESITRRISALWNNITQSVYHHQNMAASRYLFTIANQFALLEIKDREVFSRLLDGQKELLYELKRPCESFSPLTIDENSFTDTPLSKIFKMNEEGEIQLFYYVEKDSADVWVIDENGTLFYQKQHYHDNITLLNPYRRFLQSVIYRQGAMDGEAITKVPRFFQLTKDKKMNWNARERMIHDESSLVRYFNIQVIASEYHEGNPSFTYYCDDVEFSPLEYGDKLLSAVANQILSHRNIEERYPAYITDLDISAMIPQRRQVTCQYLEMKKDLEHRLYDELNKQ